MRPAFCLEHEIRVANASEICATANRMNKPINWFSTPCSRTSYVFILFMTIRCADYAWPHQKTKQITEKKTAYRLYTPTSHGRHLSNKEWTCMRINRNEMSTLSQELLYLFKGNWTKVHVRLGVVSLFELNRGSVKYTCWVPWRHI